MLYVVLLLPLILTLVTASISHFLTTVIKFSCYFSNEIGLLCVFYLWLWLILCYPRANADIKIKLKERIGIVVVAFYLLKSGWLYDVPLKRTSTWNAKFHPGLHEGMDVRTDDFLRTKISWMHRLLNFLTHDAPLRAKRARELRYQVRLGESKSNKGLLAR